MKVPYVHMIMNGRRQAAQRRFLKGGVIRRCLTLGLAAGLGLAVVVPAQADVSQTTWNKWYAISSGERAQTFTTDTRGVLDHISLMLNYDYGYGSGGTVDLRNVDTATQMPTGSPLTGSVVDLHGPTATYAYPFYTFPLPSPISVTGGTQYAIVVTITYGVRSWAGAGSSVYSGGQAWMAPGCFGTCSWTSAGYYPSDFAFAVGETAAPANSAPTVTADLDPVSVNEGAVPTASGKFSDSDHDTVTLSASASTGSAGTVTANVDGTWSWKGAAADEGQGQTITITADDGNGNTAKAQFSTVVDSVPPTAKISGAPTTAREGTTIVLTASATSPSAEDTAAPFTYAWSATDSGSALPNGTGASYTLKTNDEDVYKVTLTATDDGGFTSPPVTVTINGTDSTPAAAISFTQPWLIVPQESLTFNGSYTDAGAAVDTSYTLTWSWSDGYPSSSGPAATRTFAAAGTYTGTLTVKDDDGVGGSAAVTVTVLSPAAALAKIAGLVSSQSGLTTGQKNSLLAKLNAAADSAQRGDTGAACNQLNAFGNEVTADQKTGRISSGNAAAMIDAARLTQKSMGCFRTLVEFLSGL